MAFLKKVSPEPAGQLIEIKGDPIVIGRLQECQVILDSNGVSRKHAEIRRAGDRFTSSSTSTRGTSPSSTAGRSTPRPPPVLSANDRIKICDVEFVFFPNAPKDPIKPPPADPDEIARHRRRDRGISRPLHTLDASRSSSMASAVRPEVKLKAILEISRSLTSDLKIDTVAPKIIDALMELFPQSERGFLILIDPATQSG